MNKSTCYWYFSLQFYAFLESTPALSLIVIYSYREFRDFGKWQLTKTRTGILKRIQNDMSCMPTSERPTRPKRSTPLEMEIILNVFRLIVGRKWRIDLTKFFSFYRLGCCRGSIHPVDKSFPKTASLKYDCAQYSPHARFWTKIAECREDTPSPNSSP